MSCCLIRIRLRIIAARCRCGILAGWGHVSVVTGGGRGPRTTLNLETVSASESESRVSRGPGSTVAHWHGRQCVIPRALWAAPRGAGNCSSCYAMSLSASESHQTRDARAVAVIISTVTDYSVGTLRNLRLASERQALPRSAVHVTSHGASHGRASHFLVKSQRITGGNRGRRIRPNLTRPSPRARVWPRHAAERGPRPHDRNAHAAAGGRRARLARCICGGGMRALRLIAPYCALLHCMEGMRTL